MLFQEQESHHGMRTQPHETWDPAAKHPRPPLLAPHPPQQGPDPFSFPRAHEPGLEHIDRAAHGRGDKPRGRAGREVRSPIVLCAGLVQQQGLEGVVRRELWCGHEDRAQAIGPYASEQRLPSFFSGDAHHAVERVFVVAALLSREGGIVLHADVKDVRWVSSYPA